MQKDVNMAEKVTVDFENKQEWGFPMLGLLYSIAGEVIEDQDLKKIGHNINLEGVCRPCSQGSQ